MSTVRLAVYTFGQFIERADHPRLQGFFDREPANFSAVAEAEGFLARAGYEGFDDLPQWGPQVFPRFFVDNGDGWAPSTLSLWCDLESIMAFAYSGVHAEALRHGREWNQKPDWPPYALWWTDGTPDWAEAVRRVEHLHDHGPTPEAFDFKTPFDAAGRPVTIDRAAVKRIAAGNAARRADS